MTPPRGAIEIRNERTRLEFVIATFAERRTAIRGVNGRLPDERVLRKSFSSDLLAPVFHTAFGKGSPMRDCDNSKAAVLRVSRVNDQTVADPAVLANQIHDAPAVPLLDVLEGECRHLGAAKGAPLTSRCCGQALA
jgi:hypothetical protein